MINFIRNLLLYLLIIFSNITIAQNYIHKKYSVGNGLLHSKVTSVLQDDKGYVWFGTEGGLSRFDGIDFLHFYSSDGLAETSITAMMKAKDGTLWMGHDGGEISVLFPDLSIETIIFPDVDKKVHSIFQDSKGAIWIGTEGSGVVYIENPTETLDDKEKYNVFKADNGLSLFIIDITENIKGDIIFVTADIGTKIYNRAKKSFDFFKVPGVVHPITTVKQDKEGIYWIGTFNGGLVKYDKSKNESKYVVDGLHNKWITTIFEDSKHVIWVGTWGGGFARLEGDKFVTFDTQNGLSDNKVWAIYEDREHNLWIATNEGGVDYFTGEMFATYTDEEGILDDQVTAVCKDKLGQIWIGTNKGLSILNIKTNTIKAFSKNSIFQGKRIDAITLDKVGNLLIGSFGGGLFSYNPSNGAIKAFSNRNGLVNNLNLVRCLETDLAGNIWVGTASGISKLTNNITLIENYVKLNGLSGEDIGAILADKKGNVWIAPEGGEGLTKYTGDKFIVYGEEEGFPANRLSALAEDKEGNIWIGTKGQGIYKFDGKVFTNYRKKDGLLADFINSLIVDDENNLWIGTNYGLSQFLPNEDRFYTYGQAEGFIGIEAKHNAVFKEKNGNIWFGSANGLTRYNPSFRKDFSTAPLILINSLKVEYKIKKMLANFELPSSKNHLIFDYTGLYYSNPEGLKYSYILDGLKNATWSPYSDKRTETFPALPFGEYEFKVKAINNNGVESEAVAGFTFKINPPFYLTWWFITICLVSIISAIYFYTTWRTKKLKIDKKILEDKVVERTHELQEKNVIIEEKNKDITDSIKYAEKIQKSILPLNKEMSKSFSDYFILFKPRDIVSGDFYWFTKKKDEALIAAVDCTGHGVPGAFMSMIGFSQLNQIVNEREITDTDEILNQLSDGVDKALKQSDQEDTAKDGMDIALVNVNNKKMELSYSGAYRPLFMVRDGELEEIKADKFPIGGSVEGMKFTKQNIKMKKGDTFYLFSDGFPDQFGGEKGKKFMTKRFKELLLENIHLNMDKQKQILDKSLESWRGRLEQVDDILVIGIRV